MYHILNPNLKGDWNTILSGLRQGGLQFDAVDRTEWLDRLAKSDPDGKRNPAIKLLVSVYAMPMLVGSADDHFTSRTTATDSVSQTLGDLPRTSAST